MNRRLYEALNDENKIKKSKDLGSRRGC